MPRSTGTACNSATSASTLKPAWWAKQSALKSGHNSSSMTAIGVVRSGHPLCTSKITSERYTAAERILVSRWAHDKGPIDETMSELGLSRNIVVTVGGFAAALAIARGSDLIAGVPERHTTSLRTGMFSFALPFPMLQFDVSMFWHHRMDADPAHQWLRSHVMNVCKGP